ncbi:MAG: hypothetical protein AAEJ47_05840 [Planctomycetota bacterium]
MNIQQESHPIRPGLVSTLVVSWLAVRGLLWISAGLFFPETGYTWHTSLVDGLLGIFCISLAIQFWLGIAGVRLPVIIMLLMHIGIHLYRWAILDPAGWWAISTAQRLQVIVESGVVLVLITLLMFASQSSRQLSRQE